MKSIIIKVFLCFLLFASVVLNISLFIDNYKQARLLKQLSLTSINTGEGGQKIQVPIKKEMRDGREHIVYKEVLIKNTRQEKELALTKSYADSLERALQISIDKITQAEKVQAEMHTKIKFLTKKKDTITIKHYDDKFLSLRYNTANDSLDLSFNVFLNTAHYSKRKWFLAPRIDYIEFFSDDPRVKINALSSYKVATRRARLLNFGLQAGYGIAFVDKPKWAPYIGVGLSLNVIK